ncbi:hypothetical protein C7999DRAFT_27408 [Corynascus novoguineensis]|uniref:Uncharacterized protein n=1 Tax=Corynascus novoguineensis TaxID=1126955 RepID=A0AAN7D185_9PEZI|nr:hypothetical protein C7999DRAFT_27408 [Corynascus novoguineensis]
MAAVIRDQIITNAKFLFGPNKTFEVITNLVLYGNVKATQAVLVEIDPEGPSYKTHFVGKTSQDLAEAYEYLHGEVRRLIYQKLSESIEENAVIEVGPTVLEGSLDW